MRRFKKGDVIINRDSGELIQITAVDNTPGIRHWTQQVCPECGAEADDEYDGHEEHSGYHCSKCDWEGEECKIIHGSSPFLGSATVVREYGNEAKTSEGGC